ncbi:Meteorin-like protein [Papilio machaon]|uniref:Meteorin-like protein n=1 Tax=Papilio machaon TaxID=76193 RepID=A0A194QRS5_PAPMA|nr:Meteorin-like protein [Papilio machaon]
MYSVIEERDVIYLWRSRETKGASGDGGGAALVAFRNPAPLGLSVSGGRSERAVTPVYLRCRAGSVSWLYPRGALRLSLRPPLPAPDKDFNLCIRVIRRPDPPEFFTDLQFNDTEPGERFPARIFLEGARKLVPMYAPDDGDPREVRCVRSRRGRAALYVEAEPELDARRRVATFKYEARPLSTQHYDPATADCRPCSDSELGLAFCTSDLVSRVMIVGSEQREDLDTTQLTLRLTRLLRASAPADVATSHTLHTPDLTQDEYYRYDGDNTLSQSEKSQQALHAHVHVWSGCGASAGGGEFVAMARRRLGRLALVCAPRLQHWRRLVELRKNASDAHCTLHS